MFGTYMYQKTLKGAIAEGKEIINIGTAVQCRQNFSNQAKMIQLLIDSGYVKLGMGNTAWCTKEYKNKLKENGK